MGCGSSKAVASPTVEDKPHTGKQEDSERLSSNAKIIFVLGGPGSGKGTQCDKVIERYKGVQHFSAGDLLREAVKSGENPDLEAIMKEGKLVPMETTIGLLRNAMQKRPGDVFLIDGFPRALDQAEAFEAQIRPCDMVLAMECSEDSMRERLLERGKTSGRTDDNEETIVKRFRTFVEQSQPVIEHFKAQGKCETVSATGTPDEVFALVQAAIAKHLPDLAQAAPQVEKANGATAADPADLEKANDEAIATAGSATSAGAQEGVKTLPQDLKIVFVLGGPGSGKGTQCEKILQEYADLEVQHLSAGDLLREAVKNGNTELEGIMKEGKLVPMETTIGLLKWAMIKSGASTFLIDGFPRASDQARAFEEQIKVPDAVLFFDCSEDTMRERLLQRGETSGRADDNEETIVKRFHTFIEQSKPVVDTYKEQGLCYDISAERKPNEVFGDVKAALDVRLRGHEAPAAAPIATDAPVATSDDAAVGTTDDAPVGTTDDASAGAGEGGLPEGSKIVFVLGGPGSGKGTQCEKIVAHYANVQHFSAGDLLREAVKGGNNPDLEAIMKEGKLVPMETTIGLLRDAMVASGGSTFLIDGFPRALDQAHTFEADIRPCDAVLYFDCSEDAMRARLLERGKTSGRTDDNEDTIVKRFHTFVEQSKPVVEEYKGTGKVYEISAEQSPEDVFEEVKCALDSVLA